MTITLPGQKLCPKCENFIKERAKSCRCGHEFPVEAEPETEPKALFYDTGGPGRKQCPKCDKYSGVRTPICRACNYDFANGSKKQEKKPRPPAPKKEKKPTEIKVFEEGGRGRKQCPKCDKYVGSLISHCVCGYDFAGGAKLKIRAVPEPKPVQVFDEAGRGRKQCSACQKYVAAVTKICLCGHDFSLDPAKSSIHTYDAPGKGRKQCPDCSVYVGYSATQCVCGYTFGKEKPEPEDEPEETPVVEEKKNYYFDPASVLSSSKARALGFPRSLTAPAGEPPVRLKATDRDSVYAWAERVREEHRPNGFLSLRALKYWVNHYSYAFYTEEYKSVAAILDELYPDEVPSNFSL